MPAASATTITGAAMLRAGAEPVAGGGGAFARDVAGLPVDAAAIVAAGRVLAVHADTADWHRCLDAAATLLSRDERARVARLQRPADRDERVVAYALHRVVVAAVTGDAPRAVQLARDARGCPRLGPPVPAPRDARGGAAPAGRLMTSLSHGGGVVAIAVATTRVGIDVECASRAWPLRDIAAQVCHRDEPCMAAGDDALLALWVRKEALLKATGLGLAIAMPTFRAPAGCPLPWPDGAPGRAMVTMLDAGAGRHLAVAAGCGAGVAHVHLSPGAADASRHRMAACPVLPESRVR